MKEAQLKLNKEQLQAIINDHISGEKGLHSLFEMMVNGLMLSERVNF